MKIAVLDSDLQQTGQISQILGSTGHECLVFQEPQELLQQIRKDACDMLILDWQTAEPGAGLMHEARALLGAQLPVLMLTNYVTEDDIVAGMDAGANDCMVKPIRRTELIARVQALLRRAYPDACSSEQIHFGPYQFEVRSGRLLVHGKPVDVTHKEFDLALLFFRHIGRPLSRAFIHESVWSREAEMVSRTMDTHVSRVRNKLSLRPENGYRLAPVYSYGYRLEKVGAGGKASERECAPRN
ncbi:response regulator transcription factor [Massilia sp. W12]|uniref:response regulator transcription factor n=1 Tax=Massilia sp. W12 TaxID=3126507 RepID=UPI0030CDC3E4